jgi:type IV secretion system protein VirB4
MLQKPKLGPITDLYDEYALLGNYCLTKKGTLIGGIRLEGRDPDGLTKPDFMGLSLIARVLYQELPSAITTITQYYIHLKSAKVNIAKRDNPISDRLSKNREKFLNQKGLSSSQIVHFFEIKPDENLSKLNPLSFFKHGAMSFFNKDSREILKHFFSHEDSIVVYKDDLDRQKRDLDNTLDEVRDRWDSIFQSTVLTPNELWAYMRFFANLDPDYLTEALGEDIPRDQWDLLLPDGDRYPVRVAGEDVLKLVGTKNVYAKFLAITRFGEFETHPGIWAESKKSPVMQTGNYILMTRFCPYTKMQTEFMFSSKKRELNQKNINLYNVLTGAGEEGHLFQRRQDMKPAIRKKMESLEEAETLEDTWGGCHSYALVFDRSVEKLSGFTRQIKKSLDLSGISSVVETIDMPDAYKTFLPAGGHHSIRNIKMNSTQFGAVSLVYKANEGQVRVEDLNNEEAQYIFQGADGTPFHYSPFVSGRCVVIVVGPIRSGKSFMKNTLGSHFMKYGGIYRAVDIDQGSETLANFFGEDGAIFKIDTDENKGFNPFFSSNGNRDDNLIRHLKNLVIQMLQTNENEAMRNLESHEQMQLDQAILSTLKLPKDLRHLTSMVNHCPQELQQKLSRWYGGGIYSSLFGQDEDSIGSLDKKVAAFNLQGIKDDPVLLPLAMYEIFFRTTSLFENPNYIGVPKFLDIDEAHALLRIEFVCEYITRSVRTWGKWLGGISLCSQYPGEFLKIEDWPALRSAASAFIFMADPLLNIDVYTKTFELTGGEIEAIKNLRPKREAYIIQREIGISKKVILEVEPEQYVISTSRPSETALRSDMIGKYGFEKGIVETVRALENKEDFHAAG